MAFVLERIEGVFTMEGRIMILTRFSKAGYGSTAACEAHPAAFEADPAAFEADPAASQTLPATSQTLPTASEALPVIYLFSTPYYSKTCFWKTR